MQEAKDQAKGLAEQREAEARQRELEREGSGLRAQAEAINARLAGIEAERQITRQTGQQRENRIQRERKELAAARKAD